MKQVETEGETLDEAITKALNLLGVERDKVSLDILAEEKMGLLGFGRQNARVRATIREAAAVAQDEDAGDMEVAAAPADEPAETEPEEAAAVVDRSDDGEPDEEPAETDERSAEVRKVSVEVLTEILRLMGVEAEVVVKPGASASEFVLDVQGDSSALLIGRRGQTLESLQHILSRIVADKVGAGVPQPIVDAEDYRGRRVRSLEDMALRMGEKAKRSRKTQGIDALSARDRRVVHLALKDDPWLTTKSLGHGAFRRLLIIPEGDRKDPDSEHVADDK
ncbi:MAG: Jag N-terminal domain-containing protein [Deltaproteobacteria bacterium]|nr:Jag N-terminal domain-containing protein [Deltaproteobacteria bacterium]